MKEKTAFDVTNMPYESNPFKLLNPTFEAFGIMATEFLKLLGISILVYLVVAIPAIIGLISMSSSKSSPAGIGLLVLSVVLFVPVVIYLSYAFVKIGLAAARGQALPWRMALPKKYADAWGLFWTTLLASFIIGLGFIALIVPGLFFMLWYSQVQFLVVDEGLTGMAALSRSKMLVRSRLMDIFGLYGMNQLVGIVSNVPILGSLASIIYTIVTIPLMPIRYIQLTQLSDEDRVKIPTNKWNYLALVFGVIAVIALVVLSAYSASTSQS